MNTPRLSLAMFLLTVLTTASSFAQDDASKGKWRQLFNGKDLTGWKIKITGHDLGENFGNTFRVEDGVMYGWENEKTFLCKSGYQFPV